MTINILYIIIHHKKYLVKNNNLYLVKNRNMLHYCLKYAIITLRYIFGEDFLIFRKRGIFMTVKLGVLGFAHGHIMSYGNEWLNHPSLEYSLPRADWNSATKKNCCEKLKMEAAESVEEVLQSCDAVVISSETAFHTKLVELAANAKRYNLL